MSESKWTITQPAGPDEPYVVRSSPDGGYIVAQNLPIEDASLIAAAPDLAEALEKLIAAVEESCRTVDRQFIQLEIDTARAALSRAKGETT